MNIKNSLNISANTFNQVSIKTENNTIVDYMEFLDKFVGKERVEILFNTWVLLRKLFGEVGIDTSLEVFHHELGTILLNCKFSLKTSQNFGMRYGWIAATTYVNNSSPNLIEIFAALPYQFDVKEEMIPKIARRESIRLRKEKMREFVKNNTFTCSLCFDMEGTHKETVNELIRHARTELNYSHKTADCDILRMIRNTYQDYVNGENR